MKTKTMLLPVATAMAVIMTAGTAEARHENPLVELAHEIEDIAVELRTEFRIHYRHTRAYRHMMDDISQVLAEAAHIDRLAHDNHSSLRHIKADLEDLDALAHHLHELVDATERREGHRVDGDTRHVHEELAALNRTIHQMEDVVSHIMVPPRRVHPPVHRHGDSRHDDTARIIGGALRLILELTDDRRHCRH
ncbi:MAG: hypothetical protein HKN23_01025 [Verrucomicrobiales bacterium]|nr:hypothetical protein [Verrucomicrobiales bacterium]